MKRWEDLDEDTRKRLCESAYHGLVERGQYHDQVLIENVARERYEESSLAVR
jgi:hypothetical protein